MKVRVGAKLYRQVLLRLLLDLRQPQALDVAVSDERLANYRPSRRCVAVRPCTGRLLHRSRAGEAEE
jgi:hypothetical protein